MNKFTKLSVGIVSSLTMLVLSSGASFADTTPNNQMLVTWPYQTDARCYQIFYKETTATNWQFAVHCRDLKSPMWQYTIQGLKPNTSYTYKVKEIANVSNGKQYRWITNDVNQMSQAPKQ